MGTLTEELRRKTLLRVREAALDVKPIAGITHRFYRYPARFSPTFARACVEAFSKPGDVVLDPFMGGGTAVIEATLLGRQAIGSDINSLALFVTRAKLIRLSTVERQAITQWATVTVPALRNSNTIQLSAERMPTNMVIPSVRWLRKTISLCLISAARKLPTQPAFRFVQCVLLNVGQWALNGRKRIPTAAEFRQRVEAASLEMLHGSREYSDAVKKSSHNIFDPVLREIDAEAIDADAEVKAAGPIDLVVTSPPYPGIHMLYHRWQVDGRKESDAPYWIAGCNDGCGASFYNFADRRREAEERYFDKAERSFSAIRHVMADDGILVQMVAFNDPGRQLRKYLSMLEDAGFQEVREHRERRIWRAIPGRRWHATSKGELASSREVVLVHKTK